MAPDSWSSWAEVVVAFIAAGVTIAALIVTIRQAKKANERADAAEAKMLAAQLASALNERDIMAAELARITGELPGKQAQLSTAISYQGEPQIAARSGEIRAIEVRAEQIERRIAEIDELERQVRGG